MNAVHRILDEHTPALELEVRQYIQSMAESALDGDGCDGLGDMLSAFLSDEESQEIRSAIVIRLQMSDKQTQRGDAPPKLLPLQMDSPHSSPEVSSRTPTASSDNAMQLLRLNPIAEDTTSKPKSKATLRREARMKKRDAKKKDASELVNDDHASAWKECREESRLWGGRGRGGRGIRITGDNFANVRLPSVSLSYEGQELLVDSPMDIVRGHRYGLIGRNGVGKTTLMRQLEADAIPGLPRGMTIRMVKQQVEGREDQTTLEALVEADEYRTSLLKEQEQVERDLDGGVNLEENAQRIGEIAVELDNIDADNAEKRAMEILKGLRFTAQMIHGPTANLSGGWRMRLALAQALLCPSDLLLLDECTNHLDLHGMVWLEDYLTKKRSGNPLTIIMVSHDRSFLDRVCTDIIVMEHKRLAYHAGNYSDYQQKMAEKTARESQILDAAERQKARAMAFVQKQQQQSKKSADSNKQRQAKMMKEKKMERIGNYREDGKRYKQCSLKKLSEDYVRLAQKVVVEADEPVVKMIFPNPVWPTSCSAGSPLIQLEDVSFSYDDGKESPLLQHVTLNVTRNTKAAVVGANGCGKTTLMKLLTGEIDDASAQGRIWRHPNIRVGHITQYSVEELNEFAHMTVLEYTEQHIASGEAASAVIAKASGNVRQYLGAFGLGGRHAKRLIGALSGGERMRLCFAETLASAPHILLLDESTNHIDFQLQVSVSAALRAFQGAIVMVSHNQGFLSGFCNELWSFSEKERGKIAIAHDDTESFDSLFASYRSQILSGSAAASSAVRERQHLAKRAAKQNARAPKQTALL
ncbi:hypothetical protein ACHAXT_000954 [Thalassiosira profunda]